MADLRAPEGEKSIESRLRALESEVQLFRDEKEIREVLSLYGYNADTKNDQGYLDLWTEDGAHDVGWPNDYDIADYRGKHRWEGKEGLTRFITDPAGHHNQFYGKRIHIQGLNTVIHIDGHEAIVNDSWLSLRWHESGFGYGQIVVGGGGNDQWRLRKVDGRWKLVERRLRHLCHPEYHTNFDATLKATAS